MKTCTWETLPTPCYVADEKKLKQNLEILKSLEQETGCHVLLAQKAFSMYHLYPLIGQYISGTTASGLYGGAPWQGRNGKGKPCLRAGLQSGGYERAV